MEQLLLIPPEQPPAGADAFTWYLGHALWREHQMADPGGFCVAPTCQAAGFTSWPCPASALAQQALAGAVGIHGRPLAQRAISDMFAGQIEVEGVQIDFHPIFKLAEWSWEHHTGTPDGYCGACGPSMPAPCDRWAWAEIILSQAAPLAMRAVGPDPKQRRKTAQRMAEAFARYADYRDESGTERPDTAGTSGTSTPRRTTDQDGDGFVRPRRRAPAMSRRQP